MFNDMDLQSLMGSEIFTNYIKIVEAQESVKAREATEMGKNALDDFEKLQRRVNANLQLRETFKKLQHRFINDPNYRDTVNQSFVRGVLLLKFDEE